mgnify:CR=1 FL=1
MIIKSVTVYSENKIKIVLIDGRHMTIKVWERNDTYVMNNGKTIRCMKQKGRGNYGCN